MIIGLLLNFSKRYPNNSIFSHLARRCCLFLSVSSHLVTEVTMVCTAINRISAEWQDQIFHQDWYWGFFCETTTETFLRSKMILILPKSQEESRYQKVSRRDATLWQSWRSCQHGPCPPVWGGVEGREGERETVRGRRAALYLGRGEIFDQGSW